jgi:GTP-binding protein Era
LFKSGFVSIIGRTNVGKSTLMNNILEQKIAIMSDRPQTTRNRIQGIYTDEEAQIIFIDTPGIHKPKSKLGDYMNKTATRSANSGVDIVLFLIEPDKSIGSGDKFISEQLQGINTPVILVINKIDTLDRHELLPIMDVYSKLYNFEAIIPISALKGENTKQLLSEIIKRLPEGPKYFPEDMITDQPERQIAAEIIREKILRLMKDEIPHGTAVEIMSMKERKNKTTGEPIIDVQATIYCEKSNHKGMIIGKSGNMLKEIGRRARLDMEEMLDAKVYLQLWVKVKEGWRDSDFLLKNFGYDKKEI